MSVWVIVIVIVGILAGTRLQMWRFQRVMERSLFEQEIWNEWHRRRLECELWDQIKRKS